jgi:hypothetical protein
MFPENLNSSFRQRAVVFFGNRPQKHFPPTA